MCKGSQASRTVSGNSLACVMAVVCAVALASCPFLPEGVPAIGLSVTSHDFGKYDTEWSFEIWNAGERNSKLRYEGSCEAPWLEFEYTLSGSSEGPEDKREVEVSIDRELLPDAENLTQILIVSDDGQTATIDITATVPQGVEGGVVYVNGSREDGIEDGLSWETAFRTIQAAVDFAGIEGGGEVHIASGTYIGEGDYVAEMKNNVELWGGYAVSEDGTARRDLDTSPTILDGAEQKCCLDADEIECVIDGVRFVRGYRTSNSCPVEIRESQVAFHNCHFERNADAVLDVYYGSDVSLTNCTFLDNEHEALKAHNHSSVTLTDCDFRGTRQYVKIHDESTLYATHSTFSGTDVDILASSAEFGNCEFRGALHGALSLGEDADAIVRACSFIDNLTNSAGAAIYAYGGTLVLLEDSTFEGNIAETGASAIDATCAVIRNCSLINNASGGNKSALENHTIGTSQVTDCVFKENLGGGLTLFHSETIVKGCRFEGNTGSGGLVADGDKLALEDCIFNDNRSDFDGGGASLDGNVSLLNCSFSGNTSEWNGGGAYINGVVSIIECAFSGNSCGEPDVNHHYYGGGGLYVWGRGQVTDCIITGNASNAFGGGFAVQAVYDIRNAVYGELVFTRVELSENSATTAGGGVYRKHLFLDSTEAFLHFVECNVEGNTAGSSGGGIHNGASGDEGGTPCVTFERSLFASNVAQHWGGAIYGNATVEECQFNGNSPEDFVP